MANAGTVSSVLTKDDVVVSDELNHASIIDGFRLSRAAIRVFPHKVVDAARGILRSLPSSQRKLLITDGVFSMDGDLGALPDLMALVVLGGYGGGSRALSSSSTTWRAHSSSRPPIRQRLPRQRSRQSTCCWRNRRSSTGRGRTRACSKPA